MIARNCLGKWLLAVSGIILSDLLNVAKVAIAEVIPDETLSAQERTQVSGNPNFQIDGGARRGNNLFHSFSQFSISGGGSAYFNNAGDIQNIFSRISGGSVSNIDGLIRANGKANLFLLNPNGIVFGPNARLDIGGSFVGTTANTINFADGFQFSATAPQAAPLLTMSVPIGLQFGQNPKTIRVQGNGYDLSVPGAVGSPTIKGNTVTGLVVLPGNTLALVGGNIDIQGGTLTAEQGRIELGSVGTGQQVELSLVSQSLALSYQGIQNFQDIQFSQKALADSSGGGSIQVWGERVSLTDGSQMLVQNQGEQQGGSINVNARSLDMSSTTLDGRLRSGLDSQTLGSGTGADIAIATQQLIVRDGAAVSARSFGTGNSGRAIVNASDSVQVLGFSPLDLLRNSNIASVALGSGDAGSVSISTRQLTIRDGGGIAVSTLGDGEGGEVTVNAFDSIEIVGARNAFLSSNISAATLGNGNAGKIAIDTGKLVLRDGGTVNSSTVASGNAGSAVINATVSIDIDGKGFDSGLPSSVRVSAPLPDRELQQAYRLSPVPQGSSGDIIINTGRLRVTNGASVEASNQGTGDAGTLQVKANSIVLDRGGAITSATASGRGGNIDLQVKNLLLMQRGSQITTSAFGSGNGGNISIRTSSLVAVPKENSDISANSANARGGNVDINTNTLLGFQFRSENTSLSDITATGKDSAFNGIVQINVQDITPNNGLVELPAVVLDRSTLIANRCIARKSPQSRLIITANGSLPTLPDDLLNSPFPTYEIESVPAQNQSDALTDEGGFIYTEPDGIYPMSNGEVLLGRLCH
ncbi:MULTISPECIES: two-partner secretion domain-containing protein [Nostocales]|uniref:Filamentous hemagglutinin N-terminal domain-containing protein n=3 Tax=Nostocales TaxID=1161 RepID=A0A8S9TCE9_9CYAN|nr:filamentous hemagglutinin N-terminal domain-containing protein [Tolypothrix bouteillei]KAF3889274.1 filamentous hemagglutinin N-terminal domain-containing protein [Tolypothrix bouteillei VB521301]